MEASSDGGRPRGGGGVSAFPARRLCGSALFFFVLVVGCGGGGGGGGGSGSVSFAEEPPPEPSPAPVSVTLFWDPVTTNADGTPLTDLRDYSVYGGTESGVYTFFQVVNVTQATFNLSPGTYFFAVTASDLLGNESGFSNELVVTLSPE